MEPVVVVTGRAVPLDRTDVDTDQIIPSDWLKRVERTGFGAGCSPSGATTANFVLNNPEFVGATILVAGHNFGTGSSREHAVWALTDFGFQAVVSSRFADIFRNNSTKQGLLPVQVTEELDRALLDAVTRDPIARDHDRRRPGDDRGAGGRAGRHLPARRVHPRAAAQRVGRHRPLPAPRGRDHRIRARAPRLPAFGLSVVPW